MRVVTDIIILPKYSQYSRKVSSSSILQSEMVNSSCNSWSENVSSCWWVGMPISLSWILVFTALIVSEVSTHKWMVLPVWFLTDIFILFVQSCYVQLSIQETLQLKAVYYYATLLISLSWFLQSGLFSVNIFLEPFE